MLLLLPGYQMLVPGARMLQPSPEVGCLSLNSEFLQSKWVQESLKSRTEHFQVHLLNLGHTLEVTFLVLRTSALSAPL